MLRYHILKMWKGEMVLHHQQGVTTMANAKKAPKTLSKETQAKLDAMTQMASRIRFLLAEGLSRGDVARVLNIRYQWVRNVAITPLKNG
jgi:DNA-binding transcriptional regulator YiaG